VVVLVLVLVVAVGVVAVLVWGGGVEVWGQVWEQVVGRRVVVLVLVLPGGGRGGCGGRTAARG
jgi:hypothetical protein